MRKLTIIATRFYQQEVQNLTNTVL